MLKQSLAAGLLACAALTPVAFAQDAKPAATTAQAGSIKFIQDMKAEQFRSTNLVGMTVYNQQDENIGDISDLILDRNGRVAAVTISVGGFLGIGESEVAVSMDQLQFEPDDQAMAANDASSASGRAATDVNVEPRPGAAGSPSGTSTSAALPNQNTANPGTAEQNAAAGAGQAKQTPPAAAASDPNMAANSNAAPATTNTGTMRSTTAANTEANADMDWLEGMRVVLNTNRDDLTNAPKFGENQ